MWKLLLAILFLLAAFSPVSAQELKMAVEFNTHAACAYVALDKGFYEKEGLKIKGYEAYMTGVALAAALTKGDIDAAYMCFVPALNAFANASCPIKAILGTHFYGYGLVVDPKKVRELRDLERRDVKIACLREGTAADAFMLRTLEKTKIDERSILPKVLRVNPVAAIGAIRTKRVDTAFLPEHWASLVEDYGMKMLLESKDVWDYRIGSVLVVKEELLRKDPGVVRRLALATKKATIWMNAHPSEASRIVAKYLSIEAERASLAERIDGTDSLDIPPETVGRSMSRLEYRNDLEERQVQDLIDFVYKKGYLKRPVRASEFVDFGLLR
jgi:NitT/TauT family transport system substrate-binding protein